MNLPLPNSWQRVLTSTGESFYKDLQTGNVYEGLLFVQSEVLSLSSYSFNCLKIALFISSSMVEHPYIIMATNVAKKLPLPENWAAKEALLSDGTFL